MTPTALTLDERLALMDRAETLALAERARQNPEAAVAQLMADCEAQGMAVPRHCVEQAVRELVATPVPAAPPSALDRLVKVVVVVGAVLVGLFALRVLVPLLERLLAPLL